MWKPFIVALCLCFASQASMARDPYDVYDQVNSYNKIDKERVNPSYNAYDEIKAYKIDEEDDGDQEKESCDCSEEAQRERAKPSP